MGGSGENDRRFDASKRRFQLKTSSSNHHPHAILVDFSAISAGNSRAETLGGIPIGYLSSIHESAAVRKQYELSRRIVRLIESEWRDLKESHIFLTTTKRADVDVVLM